MRGYTFGSTPSKVYAVPRLSIRTTFPIRCPLPTESPFARQGCYPGRGGLLSTWTGVTRPSSLRLTHAPHQNAPADFRLRLIRQVLAGCCEPLLQVGGSRRYLHEPCIGAWTPTPPRSAGALTRFFPADIGLIARFTGSARETLPAMQLQRGGFFRGCSHSFTFRLPCSLDPLAAPTAEAPCPPGGWAVYTTQWIESYPSKLWHRYTPESGNWSDRTFTCWFMALPAATKTRKPSPFTHSKQVQLVIGIGAALPATAALFAFDEPILNIP